MKRFLLVLDLAVGRLDLVAAEDFHESPRQRPIWLVFAFYALMIAIGVWLLATEIADPDEQPAVAPTLSPVVVESLI